MNVMMYMATSINGYIAGPDDDVDWVSETAWSSYLDILNSSDGVVVGRRTYELMEDEEFLSDCFYYVLTTDSDLSSDRENVLVTTQSPREIIDIASQKGFSNVCVAGGAKTNASFLKEGLIDELVLDVEPVILGDGLNLVDSGEFQQSFRLESSKMLEDSLLQLRYRRTEANS